MLFLLQYSILEVPVIKQMRFIQAQEKDVTDLQKISSATFMETFSGENSEENMRQYIKTRFSTNQLLAEINNQSSRFYLVYDNEAIVAYLKLNFGSAQTEKSLENSMEIERIYVQKTAQGKKIGQLLLQKAIDIAQQQELKVIWLGVWENNKKAIDFYRKNGFEVFDYHVFVLGNDHQTDLLMKLELDQ